jgi:hypothetical protein
MVRADRVPSGAVGRLEAREVAPERLGPLAARDRVLAKWIRHNRRRGYRCLAAMAGEEVVGCVWWADAAGTARRPTSMDVAGIELEPGDAYVFGLYLAPEQRRGAGAAGFAAAVERELHGRGVRRSLVYVGEANRPGRLLLAGTGHRVERRVTVRSYLGLVLLAGGRIFVRAPGRGPAGYARVWPPRPGTP